MYKMIKCALSLLIIATCVVGIFADEFCEKQKKLDSECAKYCYQVAKPLLQMAPVCHNKDAEIKELNSKISKLVVYEDREKKFLADVKLCKNLTVQLAGLRNRLVGYGNRERNSFQEVNVKLADVQNILVAYERKSEEEESKYNKLNNQHIELREKLAVYEYRLSQSLQEVKLYKDLNVKLADMQNKLGVYEERDRKSLETENKYNELNDKFYELNKKLVLYEEREKICLEEGTKCNKLNSKLAELQDKLVVNEEREKKSLEEGIKCNKLNEKLDKQFRILLNLEEREKKDIEEINLNKQLNVQLGEVQEKLVNCEERENKSMEIYSKTESSLKASLKEYRKKLSELESSNLALNISILIADIKEDLEQFNNYKWVCNNACLKSICGVETTGSVEIEGLEDFSVHCVNDLSFGPGWMLIQKRIETFENNRFYKTWSEYRDGFANTNADFFIGLEKLYRLTNAEPHELYIDMEEWNGNKKFAHYDNFRVGNESEQYPLKDLGYYTGNAGDALRDNNNMKFSTYDRDNDNSPNTHCAKKYYSGWWHNNCTKANLNGIQNGSNEYRETGIWWLSPEEVQLKNVRMLIRPKGKM